jgi:hypothetical protein
MTDAELLERLQNGGNTMFRQLFPDIEDFFIWMFFLIVIWASL